MSPLLTRDNKYDHHRACDCVIVINKNGELTLVYIDLKSGNPIGYAGQFKSTRQFVRYALGLHEESQSEESEDSEKPSSEKMVIAKEHYIILYGGKPLSLNKTTSIPKSKIKESKPNAAYKHEIDNGAELRLKELLSKS